MEKVSIQKKIKEAIEYVKDVDEPFKISAFEVILNKLLDEDNNSNTQKVDKKGKNKSGEVKSGDGPVLTYGPAVHNNVLNMIIETAKKKKISIQRAAVSRSTGTDTDSFAYSNEGVASALISLPLKYMHTTVETVHEKDVEKVIRLMHEFVLQLKSGHDFKYLK